jgi:uncharacterized protein YndB with AHSA1/START domain
VNAVVVQRIIRARPETVFSFFSDPTRWLLWQGVDGSVDLRPGGAFRVDVTGDGWAAGRFVEVDPPHRLVFTWGWEAEANPVRPGSSTVEIDLRPAPEGTLLRLTHRDLPPGAQDIHRAGWEHYTGRLTTRAQGGDPGPDPMAGQRVR